MQQIRFRFGLHPPPDSAAWGANYIAPQTYQLNERGGDYFYRRGKEEMGINPPFLSEILVLHMLGRRLCSLYSVDCES